MAAALDRDDFGSEVFDCFLRMWASHFDATDSSVNFIKLYGFGVAGKVHFTMYVREYIMLLSSVTVAGRQTRPNGKRDCRASAVECEPRFFRRWRCFCFPAIRQIRKARIKWLKRCGFFFRLSGTTSYFVYSYCSHQWETLFRHIKYPCRGSRAFRL